MGCFGGGSPKPTLLYSNFPYVMDLARRATRSGSKKDLLVKAPPCPPSRARPTPPVPNPLVPPIPTCTMSCTPATLHPHPPCLLPVPHTPAHAMPRPTADNPTYPTGPVHKHGKMFRLSLSLRPFVLTHAHSVARTCTRTHACARTRTHARTCTRVRTCASTRAHTQRQTHTHNQGDVCLRSLLRVFACLSVFLCVFLCCLTGQLVGCVVGTSQCESTRIGNIIGDTCACTRVHQSVYVFVSRPSAVCRGMIFLGCTRAWMWDGVRMIPFVRSASARTAGGRSRAGSCSRAAKPILQASARRCWRLGSGVLLLCSGPTRTSMRHCNPKPMLLDDPGTFGLKFGWKYVFGIVSQPEAERP